MSAYVIVYRESPVRDPAAIAEYQRVNREKADPGAFNLKPLAIYGAVHAVEGTPPDGVVLLQFPTVSDAKAWYNSPAYQAAVPHRLRGADWRTIIVEGV